MSVFDPFLPLPRALSTYLVAVFVKPMVRVQFRAKVRTVSNKRLRSFTAVVLENHHHASALARGVAQRARRANFDQGLAQEIRRSLL